jgi:outer membrane protein assembly factor BamE
MNKVFRRTANSRLVMVSTSSLFLAACSAFSIHHVDVQQGNALEPKDIDQLEVGMTPAQVRYLLGEPMIDDSYHANRWDYVYYYDPGKGPVEERKLTVFFDGGQVIKIKGPRKIANG